MHNQLLLSYSKSTYVFQVKTDLFLTGAVGGLIQCQLLTAASENWISFALRAARLQLCAAGALCAQPTRSLSESLVGDCIPSHRLTLWLVGGSITFSCKNGAVIIVKAHFSFKD